MIHPPCVTHLFSKKKVELKFNIVQSCIYVACIPHSIHNLISRLVNLLQGSKQSKLQKLQEKLSDMKFFFLFHNCFDHHTMEWIVTEILGTLQ